MNRAETYRFFSILFSYPEEKWLKDVKNIMELKKEYVRLFITAEHVPCPPYESVYRDEQRRLMVFTKDVSKKYKEAGLKLSGKFKELADHISAELEFMYYLCYMENESLKKRDKKHTTKYREMQRKFLKEHIIKWIPYFCDDVMKESRLEFYREAARLLKEFIEREIKFLR